MENFSNLIHLKLFVLVILVISVYAEDRIDVVKISNVEFPYSSHFAATFDATYQKEISEFTICIRFLIESYNNNLIQMIKADYKGQIHYLERIGWEWGMERDGYQAGVMIVQRTIPGGGIGGMEFPWYHHYNIPKNIATSKERYQNKKCLRKSTLNLSCRK